MKKAAFVPVILVTAAVFFASCGVPPVSSAPSGASASAPTGSGPSDSAEAPSSALPAPESVSQPPADSSSSDDPASSASPVSQPADSPIQFYSSIEDVPYAELGYANDRKDLTKDGELWIAAPYRFGEYCFSDGKTLFIQIDARENADDPEDFYWLSFCFDHFHPTGNPMVFPVESYNKLYVRAEGYTVFTESGESLEIIKCPQ